MRDAEKVLVRPANNIGGMLRLPGDKSISHRYAMLAAVAAGQTVIGNFSTGADCASTLHCIGKVGASVTRDRDTVTINGTAGALKTPRAPLDCGNSGSTMRMLAGFLAGQPFDSEMVGDESLSRRPMRRVIDPLQRMGAKVESNDGRPPLHIHGQRLSAIEYRLPVASAQVKSAVLFAGLFANGTTTVEEVTRTRDHSELALSAFGCDIVRQGNRTAIPGGQSLRAINAVVPGDISTAAFFLCAAALFPQSDLLLENLLLNPTRAAILDVVTALGAKVTVLNVEQKHGELVGHVHIQGGRLKGLTIEGATTAALIDEIPVLAAIAPYTDSGIEIRDAGELRVKESDRIAAVATNLRAMGAQVEELPEGLKIPGGQKLHGAELQSFGDHRIAMAFSVAALRAEGDTVIHEASCARISFPEFFETLEGLVQR